MKHYKSIAYLLMLAFFVGCSGTSTFEEADYSLPELKYQPRILYPNEARESNNAGIAKVYLDISKTGDVEKVTLLKTSGYSLLDEAAMNYCKQMLFVPAQNQGEPIESHMVQKINFNLYKDYYSPMLYVKQIKDLYRLEEQAAESEETLVRDQIFEKHVEFIEEMSNDYSFNLYMTEVTLPETYTDWERSWKDLPLTFLLYHDFLQRYPDYENLNLVKNDLQNALIVDLDFIKNSSTKDPAGEENKMGLIVKIKHFVEKNYPDLSINESQLSAGINL